MHTKIFGWKIYKLNENRTNLLSAANRKCFVTRNKKNIHTHTQKSKERRKTQWKKDRIKDEQNRIERKKDEEKKIVQVKGVVVQRGQVEQEYRWKENIDNSQLHPISRLIGDWGKIRCIFFFSSNEKMQKYQHLFFLSKNENE